MRNLIELYEMANWNETRLTKAERVDIFKARLALQMFQRAMTTFKNEPTMLVKTKAANA